MRFAVEVLGCWPDEALDRLDRAAGPGRGARKLREVQSYYSIKADEEEARQQELDLQQPPR